MVITVVMFVDMLPPYSMFCALYGIKCTPIMSLVYCPHTHLFAYIYLFVYILCVYFLIIMLCPNTKELTEFKKWVLHDAHWNLFRKKRSSMYCPHGSPALKRFKAESTGL